MNEQLAVFWPIRVNANTTPSDQNRTIAVNPDQLYAIIFILPPVLREYRWEYRRHGRKNRHKHISISKSYEMIKQWFRHEVLKKGVPTLNYIIQFFLLFRE